MTRDQAKLGFAVVFLVGAVGLLGFQVKSRIGGKSPAGRAAYDGGGMIDTEEISREVAAVEWVPPAEGLDRALRSNPFLRPARVVERRRRSGSTLPLLIGIRTGPIPSAIINDRTMRVGERIAGWRIVSIERDRVTLRNSHGKTIHLNPR